MHTTVIPDTKAKTIQPIIQQMVEKGSIVVTDDWKAYKGLKKNYCHIVINHKENEYVRGGFHNNGIENFWSMLKRGIYGIYHQTSPEHLHRYCDEFAHRRNTRKLKDSERFELSLGNIQGRLKYKDLITD